MEFGRISLALLMFLRVGALVVSSPIFGRINLPNMAKIALVIAISYLFFQIVVPNDAVLNYDNIIVFIMLCLEEILIGIILGYVSYMFINLAFTAGQLIDMQMGFGMVSILDVQSNISVPISGNLLNIALLLSFFASDGHLKLIAILFRTFEAVPLGTIVINENLALVALELFSLSFVLAISVAFPIIASGLLTEVALGVIMKSVPQVNIYSIGFLIKIVAGLVMLVFLIPIFVAFTSNIFEFMFEGLESIFATLGG